VPRGPLLHQRPAKALDIWLAIYYAFGEPGQFALHHQHFMWLPCFCFPAVPHFNNRYLRVTHVLYIACEHSYQHGTFNTSGTLRNHLEHFA
jgi:hypothetical protein